VGFFCPEKIQDIIITFIHCCPVNALSLREMVGVRGSEWVTHCFIYPLILAFSLREKGWLRLAAKLNYVMDVINYPAHFDNQTLTVYQA